MCIRDRSTIFLHYLLGIVKQLDVGFRYCLLSVDTNPLAIVKKCLDVLFLQVVPVSYTHLDVYKRQVEEELHPVMERSL